MEQGLQDAAIRTMNGLRGFRRNRATRPSLGLVWLLWGGGGGPAPPPPPRPSADSR